MLRLYFLKRKFCFETKFCFQNEILFNFVSKSWRTQESLHLCFKKAVKKSSTFSNEILFSKRNFVQLRFKSIADSSMFESYLQLRCVEAIFSQTKFLFWNEILFSKRNFVQFISENIMSMIKNKYDFELKVSNSLGFHFLLYMTILLNQLSCVRGQHWRPWWSTSVIILQRNHLQLESYSSEVH